VSAVVEEIALEVKSEFIRGGADPNLIFDLKITFTPELFSADQSRSQTLDFLAGIVVSGNLYRYLNFISVQGLAFTNIS
jgi:hypothetical protein